jgi:hypothetical protein
MLKAKQADHNVVKKFHLYANPNFTFVNGYWMSFATSTFFRIEEIASAFVDIMYIGDPL